MSLVKRAQQGDQDAFVEIYERCQPQIYTFIFYRVGDTALAEDLTSEVFVRMVERIAQYREKGKPILAWLYTIARNIVTDHFRKTQRAAWFSLDESIVASEDGNPTTNTERNLTQECLIAALRHLTEDQRQVILLKFVEKRTNAQTGAILGKSEGAVKSLQHRALAALLRALKKEQCYER